MTIDCPICGAMPCTCLKIGGGFIPQTQSSWTINHPIITDEQLEKLADMVAERMRRPVVIKDLKLEDLSEDLVAAISNALKAHAQKFGTE